MTVGDVMTGYVAGLHAGYWARIGEENERWRRMVESSRVSVVEPPQVVTVGGERIRRWTWREREAARLEVLREAHGAGLHAVRAAYGCLGCAA